MTIRITNVDIGNTEMLLGNILHFLKTDGRCMFLCERSQGPVVMQRLRTKLSRVRKELKQKGLPREYFTLHNSIHPHTENGKTHDAVVVWKSKTRLHRMTESLEDVAGHGGQI